MKITITIPDTKAKRIKNSFCGRYKHRNKLINLDTGKEFKNPVSQESFMKEKIASFIKESVIAHEILLAGKQAVSNVAKEIINIEIT